MRINIEYTLYGDSTTFTVELDPDFYFDDNEDFLFGSTPRYIYPYEYLNLDKLLIEKIMLTIESDKSIYRRVIKFWNNSKNNSDILYIYDDSDKTVTEWFKIDSEHNFYIESLDFYKNEIDIWELQSHYLVMKDDFSQKFIYKKELERDAIQATKKVNK
ncbi:hypothetical protein QF023_000393 [Chryseobacterium sp. SLBN-27]|uniref:hypothetical protein n=1 Tax=Chryseobacterium sp. SLBN-27 TaxID=3042287 RepID=UPI00286600AF|nr:hypothetical protein [Chryseobacterium sp. SLBN-27]MDR6156877.1 hypothetical protein [Chryseobacterium sp. SLBN-27]